MKAPAPNCDRLNSRDSLGQSPDPKIDRVAGTSLLVVSSATWAEHRRSGPTPADMPSVLTPLAHSPFCKFLGKRKFSLPFGSKLKRKWNRKELQVPLQRSSGLGHRTSPQRGPWQLEALLPNSGLSWEDVQGGEFITKIPSQWGLSVWAETWGWTRARKKDRDQETNHTVSTLGTVSAAIHFPTKQTPTSFLIDLKVPSPRTH